MTGEPDMRRRLAAQLTKRFFVRFHLSLILLLSVAVGLLTTKGFLLLGLETMHWRWPIALLAAYLAFLLGVRIWLSYIGLGQYLDRSPSGDDGFDLGLDGGGGSNGSSGSIDIDVPFRNAGGGQFGGGGASGEFGVALVDGNGAGGGSGSWDIGDLGLDDDGFWVLLAVAALLVVIFGAGFYLVWQAPAVLAEAAFEAALAAGMIKPVRRIRDPGWVGGAIRASWLPFLVVFVCAMTIAGLVEHYAPTARTLLEAVGILLN